MSSAETTHAADLRLVGEVAADLLIERLRQRALTTSSKIVLDRLPADVREALFLELMRRTARGAMIRTSEREYRLSAIPLAGQGEGGESLLLPFLVGGGESGGNRGSDADASALRDYFHLQAEQPRILLTLTPQGNETQRSAADQGADGDLVTLQAVVERLVDERRPILHDVISQVARVYLDVVPQQVRWSDAASAVDRFLERTRELVAPEDVGAALPELGVFLKDASAEFIAGPKAYSDLKRLSEWRNGGTRLHENAAIKRFVETSIESPLLDTEEALSSLFSADGVQCVLDAVESGRSDAVEYGALGRAEGRSVRVRFDFEGMGIIGAAAFELISDEDTRVLNVAAAGPVRLEIPLSRTAEHRLFPHAWSMGRGRTKPQKHPCALSEDRRTMSVELPPPRDRFAVYIVALTGGVRSLRGEQDRLLVAFSRSDERLLLRPAVGHLDWKAGAWVCEGMPSVEVRVSDGSAFEARRPTDLTDLRDEEDEELTTEVAPPGRTTTIAIAWTEEVEVVKERETLPVFEMALYDGRDRRETVKALRGAASPQEAIKTVRTPAGDQPAWRVELAGGAVFPVAVGNDFRIEEAAATLLRKPECPRLALRDNTLEEIAADTSWPNALSRLLVARQSAFEAVQRAWLERCDGFGRRAYERVSLPLVPLEGAGAEIEAYLTAWNEAVAAAGDPAGGIPFDDGLHDALLQLDTLTVFGAEGRLERLIVLGTHPWLLSALLRFQRRIARDLAESEGALTLRGSEVEELLYNAPLEDWYVGASTERLRNVDSRPFTWAFVPEARWDRDPSLSYVVRVVRTKIARYLEMHRHLRHPRRTLRIGFVNPGDAGVLVRGLRDWIRSERDGEGDNAEQIPMVEVLLFSKGAGGEVGAALDDLVGHEAAGDDALVSRLRYRRCDGAGPSGAHDWVHLCFVHGLIPERDHQPQTGAQDRGWDGAFGDGALGTPLRQRRAGQTGPGGSDRALWLGTEGDEMRRGLAGLQALLHGRRTGQFQARNATFWTVRLPSLSSLGATYANSDWVIHLDRELNLDMFYRYEAEDLSIIEYSDQEDSGAPGFDVITVTKNAGPYEEQLESVLRGAGLPMPSDDEAAQRSARGLLRAINALSGSWALDFLLGSLGRPNYNTRIKGNVGAALVYRWIDRREPVPVDAYGDPMLRVFVSLEELIRATPAAGLPQKSGLKYRYCNEVGDQRSRRFCDDLLVLYLPRLRAGEPYRIAGRIVEVKFGATAGEDEVIEKGVEQVGTTRQILERYLAGGSHRVDADFRYKQFSLLLKGQIEQSLAMGKLDDALVGSFDLPRISRLLARGEYEVEYTIGHEGRQFDGDLFCLSTRAQASSTQPRLDTSRATRVVRLEGELLRWLAFEPDDAPTVHEGDVSTAPRLGRYRTTVTVLPEPRGEGEPPKPLEHAAGRAVDAEAKVEAQAREAREARDAREVRSQRRARLALAEATELVVVAPHDRAAELVEVVQRLERALRGHRVGVAGGLSVRDLEVGPRLIRAYVRLSEGETIASVRKVSEDIARDLGTLAPDIHIGNQPERFAIALDLPLRGFGYEVRFDQLAAHPSYAAASAELKLPVCAGIEVTGRPRWVDLAKMPHMLVAGTTGSGKTVFLRSVLLTLVEERRPAELRLSLSSSKPMDFAPFARVPHAAGGGIARSAEQSLALVEEMVQEMERRYEALYDALVDDIGQYNEEHPSAPMARWVAVLDEYSETVLSMERDERKRFEAAVARLAQKSRAAGIHLIICMQRPDATVLQGPIKSNVLHRFALKLPQQHDSRVILDDGGAETLLGQGDLLYKDDGGRLHRLQVPNLTSDVLRERLRALG